LDLIYEESLEKKGNYGCTFTQYEENGVEPREISLEDGKKCHLRQIGDDKERWEHNERDNQAWNEPCAKEGLHEFVPYTKGEFLSENMSIPTISWAVLDLEGIKIRGGDEDLLGFRRESSALIVNVSCVGHSSVVRCKGPRVLSAYVTIHHTVF
jgi:hypothetical protein